MTKMKVIHIHTEYPEHSWMKDDDGEIDEWAMEFGYHNGPMCERCYESFCVHCEDYEDHPGPCVTDEWKCPNCGRTFGHSTHYNFCYNCGQALDWSE